MCDAMLEQKIRDKLWDMVRNTETFTAFDVTKALRAENPNMSILHYEVRTVVHDMFNNEEFFDGGDYQRTLVKLKCGPNALVFHPDGFDPLDHPEADVPMSSALPCGPSVTTDDDDDTGVIQPLIDNDDDDDDDTCVYAQYPADNRGRLCIRKEDLKGIDLVYGDTAYVSVEKGVVLVSSKKPMDNSNYQGLLIDKDGCLRLSPHWFREAVLRHGSKEWYRITRSEDVIEIEGV